MMITKCEIATPEEILAFWRKELSNLSIRYFDIDPDWGQVESEVYEIARRSGFHFMFGDLSRIDGQYLIGMHRVMFHLLEPSLGHPYFCMRLHI